MKPSEIPYTQKAIERFESMAMPIPITGCWEWIGAIATHGYGYFGANGKSIRAHRASYQIYKGKIGDGLYVLHSCDNPSCVNPDHLWLGTQKDNIRDRNIKGRHNLTGRRYKHKKNRGL